jgi:hypothetical protein
MPLNPQGALPPKKNNKNATIKLWVEPRTRQPADFIHDLIWKCELTLRWVDSLLWKIEPLYLN